MVEKKLLFMAPSAILKLPKWHSLLIVVIIICFNCFISADQHQLSALKSKTENILKHQFLNRRFVRSPFAPPVVTALKPNERSKEPPLKRPSGVGISHNSMMSPIANSQTTLPKRLPENEPSPSIQKFHHYSESYSPMLSSEQNNSKSHFSLKLQNDQSLGQDTNSKEKLRIVKAEEKALEGKSNNIKRSMQFLDYNQVLRAINKTNGELQKMLRKKKIPFLEFLEFIQNGASKDQIRELLSKEDIVTTTGHQNIITVSDEKNEYFNNDMKLNKKKVLQNLPFEEIVHQIPPDKTFLHGKKLVYSTKDQSEFDGKEFSLDNDRPARDSPIVTHFSRSRPQVNETRKSAAILSMSIVKPEKAPEKKIISKHNMFTRNKLLNNNEPHMESDSKWIKPNSSTDKSSPYQQLRLVFPVKGILVFCGILGSVALVTILILIIYGSIKCSKQKPIANNYQVNERIELTSAQCE